MAQLVEQRPYKAKVGSSSLSGSTSRGVGSRLLDPGRLRAALRVVRSLSWRPPRPLLDIAAGAFSLTPDELLDKVAVRVADGSDVPVG